MVPDLVSIIIPTYNRANLIRESLDSVLAQTYPFWECIIVDDGSTDDTEVIINQYCDLDNRFHYIKRPENRLKGANSCRNIGFENSNGEYINWLDSDDIWSPNLLSYQLEVLINSNKSVSVCQSVFFKNNNILDIYGIWKSFDNITDPLKDVILYNLAWQTTAALWSRGVIPSKPFDEDLLAAQEWLFHCKQMSRLKFGSFNFSNEILVYVRKTESPSIGNTNISEIRNPNYLRARNKLFDYLINENSIYTIEVVKSVAALIVKIIYFNNRDKDLLDFEFRLMKMNSLKWCIYIIFKQFLIVTKLDIRYSKRIMRRILSQ